MTYNVSFDVSSSWNTGFVASISLANANPSALNGWTVEFNAPFQITNLWNGTVLSHVGNHYVVQNASWNSTVPANGTVAFGFQAENAGPVPQPTAFSVNGQSVAEPPDLTLPTLSVSDVNLFEGNAG